MNTRTPAEVFAPGDVLKEELEARNWTQADLASIIGKHVNTVNDIIVRKRGITPEIAEALGAALGTSAELWLNLNSAYQLHQRRTEVAGSPNLQESIAKRARIYEKAPIQEMVRRGWIENSDNPDVLEQRLCRFLEITNIEDQPSLLHAARKSTSYAIGSTSIQMAWLFRAKQLARLAPRAQGSQESYQGAVARLRPLMESPAELRHVPKVLADAGIRLVVVQPLINSRIDGACFWEESGPVIAMSLRHDRIDNFWFVLLHELHHAFNRLELLDEDLKLDEDLPGEELAANRFASNTLVPEDDLESLIRRVGPYYRAERIKAFANLKGVHPAIVVGQLQHRGEIPYSQFRKMMDPVREWIIPATVTDGWGIVSPAIS